MGLGEPPLGEGLKGSRRWATACPPRRDRDRRGGYHRSPTPPPSSSSPGPLSCAPVPRGVPARLSAGSWPLVRPQPLLRARGGPRGKGISRGGGLLVLAWPLHLRLAGAAGQIGGLGLPACTRGAVHRGRAAHLLSSPSAGVSPASQPQGSAGEGHQPRRQSSRPRLPAPLPPRGHGRTNGEFRPPGLYPRGSAEGQGRSPGALPLDRGFTGLLATGTRRRGPVQATQGLSLLPQSAAFVISEAIGPISAWSGVSRSGAIFFSLPGIGRISA
ncbi:hypothetical protein NDU88_006750 [Pleurodeles waltl]|uniref:Uncharacterized protein n=1 Tax=Pleurodeles waltl TaxID=8319 RepID=A0AAV7VMS7_PLEWA|nr:hypothetical protein NDU88_006750 [Pleurodeles waltl]